MHTKLSTGIIVSEETLDRIITSLPNLTVIVPFDEDKFKIFMCRAGIKHVTFLLESKHYEEFENEDEPVTVVF